MASNGVDPTTGAKKFPEEDALQIGADLEEVSAQAVYVGTRIVDTTAKRLAYPHARKGLEWFDTDLNIELIHNGTTWVPTFKFDTGWVNAPSLSTGWSPSSEAIQYRVKNGLLFWSGRLNGTSAAAAQVFADPLPVGARVDKDAPVTISETNSALNRVPASILANGHLQVFKSTGTPTELSLATLPARPVA